jgi:hypothetical protein
MKQKTNIRSWLIGALSSVAVLLIFGIPTNIIPNRWYTRMIPADIFDYIFLVLSSLLLGTYVGLEYHQRKSNMKCDVLTCSGGIGSFFALSCPVCIKILVLLFGAAALMTYFEPFRPLLGLLSISVLGIAIYYKIRR